eukprot:7783735-Pyramimonas_sp.AAC.1
MLDIESAACRGGVDTSCLTSSADRGVRTDSGEEMSRPSSVDKLSSASSKAVSADVVPSVSAGAGVVIVAVDPMSLGWCRVARGGLLSEASSRM